MSGGPYLHTAIEDAFAMQSASAADATATRPIRARILWPALGCPAVVTPRENAPGDQPAGAQHRICVLLLSDRERLSAADAAAYLRLVPWEQRTRRFVRAGEPGAFGADELRVRSDSPTGTLTRPHSDARGEAVVFGGDRYETSVVVSLARSVRRFYAGQGLRHLHEICVSESACARLAADCYQLIWNGREGTDGRSSEEMAMLIEGFARPRRRGKGRTEEWRRFYREQEQFLIEEYRVEYGALHEPYRRPGHPAALTEVLHPVFVKRVREPLTVAHVTDTHVDTRMDVYEENLRRAPHPFSRDGDRLRYRGRDLHFNNWNRSFSSTYEEARANASLILMTGDLIDYGRGHVGLMSGGAYRHRLDDDEAYHEDRNWFLFYYLLASGNSYTKPVYTILGNHDWRLNPYPPFAPGAPSATEMIHNYAEIGEGGGYNPNWLKEIVEAAHGPGHEQRIPMYGRPRVRDVPAALIDRLDKPGTPLETRIESVEWYLLLINPFLDYALPLPGGQQLLMLDWGEDEEINDADWLRRGTPRPANSLSALQKWHVTAFTGSRGSAKIVGIHAPVLGPSSQWTDADLERGEVTYARPRQMRRESGELVMVARHTLYATKPRGEPIGVAAGYGAIARDRDWLVEQLAGRVRLVATGHIHRDGLFAAPRAQDGVARLLRRLPPAQAIGGAPLYVNTSSAGPRGYQYHAGGDRTVPPRFNLLTLRGDGVIGGAHLRQLRISPPAQRAGARQRPAAQPRPVPTPEPTR